MLFGIHCSVSKGFPAAVEYATSVGAECMQVFAKSPRQWRAKPMDPDVGTQFELARERHGMGPAFSHTAYLINLTTTDDELRDRSIDALADELVRGSILHCDGVVTHTGTDPSGDAAAAADRLAASVIDAFERAESVRPVTARLLLENTAGGGTTFGCDWQQLASAIAASALPAGRLGVCIDTCHAFAFGYALDTAEGWHELLEGLDSSMGLDRLGLLHVNDCMFPRGSRRDRHAWIGDGFIGMQGFQAMVAAPELADTPGTCEMPGEVPLKDSVNIERLKELRAHAE